MYVDKEDRDVISMCNENKRRSGITTTVGYFVPKEQAHRIVTDEAVSKRRWNGMDFAMVAMVIICLLVITVAELVG